MFEFFFLLFLIALIVSRECFERKERKDRYKSWEENRINGYREYVIAWDIYWNQIVPEVFAEAHSRYSQFGTSWLNGYTANPSTNSSFGDIAKEKYGFYPQQYASLLAKKKVIALGYRPFNGAWRWDEHKHRLADETIEEEKRNLENRLLFPARDLCSTFAEPISELQNDPLVLSLLPKEDDDRKELMPSLGTNKYQKSRDINPWF